MRNKERRGGRGRRGPEGGGGAQCLFPQALDTGDLAEELRTTQRRSLSHPPLQSRRRVIFHLPALPLCICRGVQSLAVGRAMDLGSSHLSPSLHQLALEGRGAGMPVQAALSQH